MQVSHERIQHKLRYELGSEILAALEDEQVLEIMLNEDGRLWLDTYNGMKPYGEMESSKAYQLICTIASITGMEVHAEHPDIAAEVKLVMDGTMRLFRFQGLLPPLVIAPIFAIRKPAMRLFSLSDYVQAGMLTKAQEHLLKEAVNLRQNILVVGGTGSGKTTLCNAILQEIARQFPEDRVILMEDTLELQCEVKNKLQLRTSDNRQMDDLLRYGMRLRPDRIVVGEVRGKEAHSLIKAWNTGHPGGLSTVHANDAYAGLMRLMQLIEEAGVKAVPEAIAQAVNRIIFITKNRHHPAGRHVTQLLAIEGYDRVAQSYHYREL